MSRFTRRRGWRTTRVVIECVFRPIKNHPNQCAQQNQVNQHLDAHDKSHGVRCWRDVPEANCRKDGDGEIERTDVIEVLSERMRRCLRRRQIDTGKDDEKERDDGAERLDCSELGDLALYDAAALPHDHHSEHRQADDKAEDWTDPLLNSFGSAEVRRKDQYPRQSNKQDSFEDCVATFRLREVTEAFGLSRVEFLPAHRFYLVSSAGLAN